VVIARPGRFRLFGPFVALLVPLTLVLLGLLVLALWPCSGRGCIEPSLGAWLLVLFAVPMALPAGIPWYVNPLSVGAALLASLALWMILGAIAGRRTARQPDAGWLAFTGELLTLTAGVIAGVLLGLVLIAVWLRL
jgi:hypothetical protein